MSVLGPAPKCGRRQGNTTTVKLVLKPTQFLLPCAPEHGPKEALLPTAASLLALVLSPRHFFSMSFWGLRLVVVVVTSWIALCPQALPSALVSLHSPFPPWAKSPTLIYMMPRPKSLSPSRFPSWGPTASWPSIPRQPTGTTSSLGPELPPHHHTRLFQSRSQFTFLGGSLFSSHPPSWLPVFSFAGTEHRASPQILCSLMPLRPFTCSSCGLGYFFLLQAQLRCPLS